MVKHWDTVKEKLGVVWEWMKVTFGKVVDFFKEALEKILQFFLAPIIVIKEGWDEFIGWVKEVPGKIQGFFEGIGDKISGHFSGLKEKVGSHFQQTGEQVVYLMNAMGVDTNQLAQNMVKNYEAAGGGIKGVFTAQMGAMKDVVSGIMDKLGIDTSQILQNMLQFFVSIGTNIGQAALNIWTSIQNTFKNAWNTAMEWGKNVVQGLWAGIQSLAGWIWGKVMEFAKGIFDSIKRGLGALWPFSPSEAGVDIGEGLLLGIRKGIMDSLRLLNDMDLLINPRLAGVGMGAMGSLGHAGAGDTYGDTVITGNQFVIREDADIERIAVALERRRRARHV
jgi:phage-related protein